MRLTSLRGSERWGSMQRVRGRADTRPSRIRGIGWGWILPFVLGGLLVWAPGAASQELPDLSAPLDLDTVVRLALERNLGVSQAEQSILRASGNRSTAISTFVPKAYLSTNYNYSRSRFNQATVDPNTGRFILSAREVTDEVYTLGVRGNQSLVDLSSIYSIKGAGHSLDAARAGLADTRVQTVLAAKQQYYALVRAKELAQVNQEDYDLREEQLRRAQSLFDLGSVAKSDVLQAQVNLATAERERISSRNDVENQRARLAVLLALPVDSPLEVVEPPPVPETPQPGAEADLMQEAFERRPDLREARESLWAAKYSEKSARWSRVPSLDGSYSWNKQEDTFGSLFDNLNTNRRWGLAVGLSVTLFDGFQTRGSIQRATADRRTQEDALRQKRLDVALDVRVALLDIKTATEGIRSARDGVALAEESVRLQKALYESGGGTLLEWNNAQVELTRARVALVDAEVNLRLAQASLESALGEGAQ